MPTVPVVVIVGRPNVGKSTLFNALTRTRDALVADMPGVTRDRIYGRVEDESRNFILVDTGGLDDADDEIMVAARHQTRQAIEEADLVVLLTDARAGILPADHDIAALLRVTGKPVIHAVNKTDGLDTDMALAEASELGLGQVWALAASHRRGIQALQKEIVSRLPAQAVSRAAGLEEDDELCLTFIGRPNAGKSTLMNRFLGEQRALATPVAGTTRDPVRASVERDDVRYRLVDTAGVRRRLGSHRGIERLSSIKALQAIEQAHVVCLVCDALEGITEQDARLAGHVIEAGRGLVIAVNKWDAVDDEGRKAVLTQAAERLEFARFAPLAVISALHGSGLGELTDAVEHVFEAATREMSTGALTRVLRDAIQAHPPPMVQRRMPRLRYAHMGGRFPTLIVIHGSRTAGIADQYKRYLVNVIRKHFELTGIPVRLAFREGDNPYAGRRSRRRPGQPSSRKKR
ncbi:MAG TPA: ribosome biogenesis GTPase Der [Wenzhouxiangella sp.]|nr:ribosome biogenesis GTPase Der [Wenzhouxiangella sp.]